MTDRELMQQALDALEHLQTDVEWQYKSPTRAMLRKIEKALRARLAQPEPEPFGWVKIEEVRQHFGTAGCGTIYKTGGEGRVPLYTAPPQREWVKLTDDDIDDVQYNVDCRLYRDYARAIEAKLRDKNS